MLSCLGFGKIALFGVLLCLDEFMGIIACRHARTVSDGWHCCAVWRVVVWVLPCLGALVQYLSFTVSWVFCGGMLGQGGNKEAKSLFILFSFELA